MLLGNWLLGHSLLVLLSLGTVFNLCWLWICRNRLRFSRWTVPLLAVLHTIFGVLSVRCMAFLETGSGGNMSLYGGMFLMPVFYGAVACAGKKRAADVFDVFTVCMLFTLLCARVNCIWKGCCAGLPIPGTGLRWPTRQLEILYYIAALADMAPKAKNGRQRGMMYPLYMASYGGFRFITEFFRTSSSGQLLHMAHLWSALAVGLGISIYSEIQSKQKKGGDKKCVN